MENTQHDTADHRLAATTGSPLAFQEHIDRAGFWVVALRDRRDILEVRRRNNVLFGRFRHEEWWTRAVMVNGMVAGPFKSRRSALAANDQGQPTEPASPSWIPTKLHTTCHKP